MSATSKPAKRNGHLVSDVPSLFDDFFRSDFLRWPSLPERMPLPAVNVKETNSAFELELAVPGMKKEDFRIELDNDTLTISCEKENANEEKDKEGNYTRREFSYQSFSRSFRVPENTVLADKISANYKDGILCITVPKSEQSISKAPKQIKVS